MKTRTLRIAVGYVAALAIPAIALWLAPARFTVSPVVEIVLAGAGFLLAAYFLAKGVQGQRARRWPINAELRWAAYTLAMSIAVLSPTDVQQYLIVVALLLSGWAVGARRATAPATGP